MGDNNKEIKVNDESHANDATEASPAAAPAVADDGAIVSNHRCYRLFGPTRDVAGNGNFCPCITSLGI